MISRGEVLLSFDRGEPRHWHAPRSILSTGISLSAVYNDFTSKEDIFSRRSLLSRTSTRGWARPCSRRGRDGGGEQMESGFAEQSWACSEGREEFLPIFIDVLELRRAWHASKLAGRRLRACSTSSKGSTPSANSGTSF